MTPLSLYKNLADDTRLKAVLLIAKYGEICVCDLMQVLELSQPKVSRHLAELRRNQLLLDERRGKWVFYRLHPALPDWVRKVVDTTISGADAELTAILTSTVLDTNNSC